MLLMRILVQRISEAWVDIDGRPTPRAGAGMLALVGFRRGDHVHQLPAMATKLLGLRIFDDAAGRINRSLADMAGDLVLVSQFTLYADLRRGRRPGFDQAMPPEAARALYDGFVTECRRSVPGLVSGEFGADMAVHLINDGPFTIMLDSDELNILPPVSP